jgi:predicted MFS family arabinose efflux permease
MTRKNRRKALLWLLGGICIFFGSMLAGNLKKSLGVTDVGYFLASFISLLLILLGGLMWISVAIATKK